MFQDRLKELRLSYGFNQVDLASKLGITKQCVSNWENGNVMPSIEMLINLARFFNVSSDYLLDLTPKQTVLNVDGLTDAEITHIKFLIADLQHDR